MPSAALARRSGQGKGTRTQNVEPSPGAVGLMTPPINSTSWRDIIKPRPLPLDAGWSIVQLTKSLKQTRLFFR